MNENIVPREAPEHYMELARRAALRSPGKSTKVGCVIVPDNGIVIAGCCDFPGITERLNSRLLKPAKYQWLEHAERMCIYQAAEMGIPLHGAHLYMPWYPCHECARGIVASGISEIFIHAPDFNDPVWGESFQVAARILFENNVQEHIMGVGRP